MKTLKEQFVKNGYLHTMVWRDNEYVITKLTDKFSGMFVCYEAFKVKIHKPSTFSFNSEAFESSPSNEVWGKTGYSVHTLDEAHKKINQLKQKKSWTKKQNKGLSLDNLN